MYIELHARSAFSFLEGASLPEDLIARSCAHSNLPAMALLDRDGVYGAPRFHLAAQKNGIQGAHRRGNHRPAKASAIRCCRRSRAGYQNLCRLITRMKLRAAQRRRRDAPRDTKLAEYAARLICLTGGDEGPLAHALSRGGTWPSRIVEQLLRIFGRENVYVELQRHYNRDEEARNQAAIELAQVPALAAAGHPRRRYAHRTSARFSTSSPASAIIATLDTRGRLLAHNSERHLKSPQQMLRLFADLPEAIANTRELSSRLEFTLNDLGYKFPHYPVPDGETMNSFLRKRTDEGARDRYRRLVTKSARRDQIERELALIEKLELAGYFLIVWDIVRFCREQGILVQGRGSAANSAVCYSLGITAVDPVGMELLFERFLSEERGEWPDIDLDLPSGDQRERAIQYVYERYGKLGAAMTANVITYRGRSAAREVGKVLGFDDETPRSARRAGEFVGIQGLRRHARAPVPRCRLRLAASAHPQILRALCSACRICRAISGSIPAAW